MRKRKQRNVLILIFISIIVFLGIIYKTVNDKRNLSGVESLIKDTGLFINKVVSSPINYVSNKIKESSEKKDLYTKYKKLKQNYKSLEHVQSKKEELEYELEQMKKILELNNLLSKESYLNATVINRNLGLWYNTITIDKGSKNGVKVDMPVIISEGLIGKVIKTSNFNSTVKLLTSDDINNKISVKIKNGDNYIMGLLTNYDVEKNVFIVEGIDQNLEIQPNSLVTTTGLGGYFPSGIIVGKVKMVNTDHFDLSKIVEVESFVDFNQISFVTILKKEEVFK